MTDPDFAKQLAWLGECSDDQIKRRIEAELDHAGWRSLRPLLLGLVLVVVSIWGLVANAAEAACPVTSDDLSWTLPATRVDGTPLLPAAISSYRLERAPAASGPWTLLASVTHPQMSYCSPLLAQASYYRATIVLASALESAPTGAVKGRSLESPPNPPLLLTVGGSVYTATPNYTTFSWRPGAAVGTIAKGIKCDATRHIPPDYWRVTSPIVWAGAKKNYVVAQCEPSS